MVSIKSNKVTVNKGQHEVYEHLTVPENYRELMPGRVRSFEARDDSALLDIEGIGKVDLSFTTMQSPELIVMRPTNKVPFEFDLQWTIEAINDSTCEVQAVINAKLNFMMRMVAEKVLKDFLDKQTKALENLLNNS